MQYKGELTVVLKYIPAEKNLTLPLDQVQGTFQAFLPVFILNKVYDNWIYDYIIALHVVVVYLIHCFISQSSFV